MVKCLICRSPSDPLFTTTVLGKYDVGYHRCSACGFIQTDTPHWLEESYSEAINDIDIGPVNRAVMGSRTVEGVILSAFDPKGRFLDYGAGYGVLVRLMRDRGFDFRWYDAHCQNLFAKHFPHALGDQYELVTAFEVLEHLADPLQEIEKILSLGKNLFFSTLLVPPGVSRAEDWPYFGPEHGQHIAFYTLPALRIVAERFGLHLASDGNELHLLSQRPISERIFRMFARDTKAAKIARQVMRRRAKVQTLLYSDFRAISGY